MNLLAIETSCDDSSVAVLKDGQTLLALKSFEQIKEHAPFGGVVPEIASRAHERWIQPLIQATLESANLSLDELDAIAVTQGPGLLGSLMVGQMAAKALALALKLPLITVNHLSGHIYSNFIGRAPSCPAMVLIVSGGHTHLYKMESDFELTLLGKTLDDAVGEAFDKTARLLGLEMPGGPAVQKLAEQGDAQQVTLPSIQTQAYDFSYSGLKTAVAVYLKKNPQVSRADLASAFQKEAVAPLVIKTIQAAKQEKVSTIYVAGGVSANQYLREQLTAEAKKYSIQTYFPPLEFCTDNAAMIARAGYHLWQQKKFSNLAFKANPALRF